MSKKILFVCTGNTCRSSMAEYIFKDLIQEQGREDDFIVCSAGVAALENDPAANQAITVLERRGITSIKDHQATLVHDELVEEADLILTMTRNHKKRLLQLYPDIEERIFTLKEFIQPQDGAEEEDHLDISDPFGQPVEVYEQCATELEDYLRQVVNQL